MVRAPCSSELGLKKGPWSPEEDQILIDHVEKHGHGSWRALPKIAGLNRCGKSCRLRWINYLKPDIKRGNFSEDEERTIINLHSVLGNKWSRISEHLPGRTDNEIKNFWNTKLRKKLFQTGLDPKTHKPITPNLNLLINLSHLLSSPSNSISPMTNVDPLINAYSYQEAAINQLAQLQLVHNILQVANMCKLPNLAPTKSTMDPTQEWIHFRHGELLDHSDMNGLSHGTCSGNTLPGLVTTSPESSSIVNQMNYAPPMHNAPTSCLPESDVFEGWEKLVDDEAISSFLRDIIVD